MIRSLTLVTLLLVGTTAFACPKGGKMMKAIEQLELDESRAAEVQTLFEQGKEEKKALKEADATREEMRAHRDTQRARLAEILTEEELDTLHELKKQGRKRGGEDCEKSDMPSEEMATETAE